MIQKYMAQLKDKNDKMQKHLASAKKEINEMDEISRKIDEYIIKSVKNSTSDEKITDNLSTYKFFSEKKNLTNY